MLRADGSPVDGAFVGPGSADIVQRPRGKCIHFPELYIYINPVDMD